MSDARHQAARRVRDKLYRRLRRANGLRYAGLCAFGDEVAVSIGVATARDAAGIPGRVDGVAVIVSIVGEPPLKRGVEAAESEG